MGCAGNAREGFLTFLYTKARGMGLGLPIVKRTVFDHNGRVDIDTSASGTAVSVCATRDCERRLVAEGVAPSALNIWDTTAGIPQFLV